MRSLRVIAWAGLLALGAACSGGGPKKCADTLCATHQLCTEAMGSTSASCAPACDQGFSWDGTACVASTISTCLPAPAEGSIALRCAMEHKSCSEPNMGAAVCSACLPGFVDVGGGTCEATTTCAQLNCGQQNRDCSDTPNGHCTTCVMGMVEDTPGGACRAPKTCADVNCMPGFSCVVTAGMDATCRMGGCGPGSAPMANGGGCVMCRIACGNRPGGTGSVYLDRATLADTCICQTQPGYFWDEGAPGGGDIRACDQDGDGWVRVNAKKAYESADQALKVNARCSVQIVDTFVLTNDQGESKEVPIDPPIGLYEPERNDDQGLLDDAVAQGRLPTYSGRALRAEELNALTKACVWKTAALQRADFNENNFEDVDEGHDDPAQVDPNNPLSRFANFSYFLETNRGWYEPPTNSLYGKYHVQEKLRGSTLGDGLALELANVAGDGGEYWKTCDRRRDSGYMPGKPGFDFAKYSDGTWRGMGHHAQFRCIRLVSQSSGAPQEYTRAEAAAQWTINRCTPMGTSGPLLPLVPTGNPSDPVLRCAPVDAANLPDPRTSTTAPVLWAISKYQPYDDLFGTYALHDYARGCVNACAEYPNRCPGFNPIPELNSAQCVGQVSDFGRLRCGCGISFSGDTCEVACTGNLAQVPGGPGDLFLSTDFAPAPRTGYWMCSRPVGSVSDELVGTAATGTSTFSIRGAVSARATPVNALCQDGGNCQAGFGILPDPLP
ncbi:MAG: hypothetical protein U1E65_08635 [Myxococcota bacterium]